MSEPTTSLPGGAPEDLASLSYEQARAALDQVVTELESSTVNLEMSLALWERGNALADICQAHLDGARQRIEAARPVAGQPADG
jgi:exodeoxyribonuclease VII small subunit